MKFGVIELAPFRSIPGELNAFTSAGEPSLPELERWQFGRIGIILLVLGFNLMQYGSQLLCPRKDMPGSIWRPGFWQRRHMLYTSIWLFMILLLALEFSFSTLFKLAPSAFMIMFKFIWMYMEIWLLKSLTEKMVACPLSARCRQSST